MFNSFYCLEYINIILFITNAYYNTRFSPELALSIARMTVGIINLVIDYHTLLPMTKINLLYNNLLQFFNLPVTSCTGLYISQSIMPIFKWFIEKFVMQFLQFWKFESSSSTRYFTNIYSFFHSAVIFFVFQKIWKSVS